MTARSDGELPVALAGAMERACGELNQDRLRSTPVTVAIMAEWLIARGWPATLADGPGALADALETVRAAGLNVVAADAVVLIPCDADAQRLAEAMGDYVEVARAVLGQLAAGRCCDLHGRNCEPPSELCCWQCTEAAHPAHGDGTPCSSPDLSGSDEEGSDE